MTTTRQISRAMAAVAFAGLFSVSGHADPLSQHPAVLVQAQHASIDPNTFIVAHPAGLAMKAAPTTHEHPAVVAWRQADRAAIDPNTFTVLPPASTTWTLAPASDTAATLAIAN